MGVKIKDLPQARGFKPNDSLLLNTEDGAKKMPISVLVPNTPAAHNNFVRGKVLTDEYSLAEIYAMVAARDYHDIFVGDKIKVPVPAITETGFTAATVEFLVAEIESHWNYGDNTSMNKGHLCLVPAGTLGNAKMNDTNTTEGAYEGSKMYTTVMPAVQAALEAAFGETHVLNAREFISKAVDTTHQSKGVPNYTGCTMFVNNWQDCKVRLMTELEACGSSCFSSSGEDDRCGLGHQLSLFRQDHTALFNRATWWLSAVSHSTIFCTVNSSGNVYNYYASTSLGVRPRFTIG